MTAPLSLRRVECDALPTDAADRFERTAVAGVLATGGYRAHRAQPTGTASGSGYAWRLTDQWTGTWWPQGVAVGEHDGIPLALVTWYAKPRRGLAMGARLSIVDLRDAHHPRYHHVLLVSPGRTGSSVEFEPLLVHAGGIAWSGDRLLVAATFDGLLEFRLGDILTCPRRWPSRSGSGPFGYRHLLPVAARYEPVAPKSERMRYSFITVDDPGVPAPHSDLKLLAGEYGRDPGLRLARISVTDAGARVIGTHPSPVPQMQGVAVSGERWFVSSSEPGLRPGDLWSGPIDDFQKHAGALPPGPQALCVWPGRNELWSVSEEPGKRWLFPVDLAKL